jgi:hypothetical protein
MQFIEPVFATSQPNAPVILAREQILLVNGQDTREALVDVVLRFLPRPRVVLELVTEEDFFTAAKRLVDKVAAIAEFPDRGFSCEIILTRLQAGQASHILAILRREPLTTKRSPSFRRAVFHIVNFIDATGSRLRHQHPDGSIEIRDVISLESPRLRISIQGVPGSFELVRQLREVGGYGITHVGLLEEMDGEPITPQDVSDELDRLGWYLSFARGSWASPALPLGFGDAPHPVFEEWGVGRMDSWSNTLSWFDKASSQNLESLFPGFIRRWSDARWTRHIKTAIYWYVQSNLRSTGFEGSIILTQSGLELVSWVYHVEAERCVSKAAFKKLPAADKIRLLLSRIGIPLAVRSELANLVTAAQRSGLDGPGIFTAVRNSVVHPDGHLRGASIDAHVLYESWNLGQWYLELALLRLFGASGKYADRIDLPQMPGKVRDLPWPAASADL